MTGDQASAQSQQVSLKDRIFGAFAGDLPAAAVPVHYRLGLLLVALGMVLLPLIYIGIIGLAGYGLYYHATHDWTVLNAWSGGRVAALAYFGPLVIGGILILFMIKPLFAPRAKAARIRALTPEEEPLLFAFVARLCRVVGAPMPRSIVVDCAVNASAGFHGGAAGLLGRNLRLTIGLPLAAGLTLRQFAGVLAHEFGHFTQSGGMRVTFVIRSVSHWFQRVVHERDAWDMRLEAWASKIDIRIGIILHLARLCVWLTRRILWGLALLGHLISCYMLRQMEFDADRREIALAGSADFVSVSRRMAHLAAAAAQTQADLANSWREGRLADNYPGMILTALAKAPTEALADISRAQTERPTGFFDTHPADRDRLAQARTLAAEGVFTPGPDVPAVALFGDFDRLAHECSLALYSQAFKRKIDAASLVSNADLDRRQSADGEAFQALRRFTRDVFLPVRPFPLPTAMPAPAADAGAAHQALAAARETLAVHRDAGSAAVKACDALDTRALELEQAGALLDANFKVDPRTFKLPLWQAAAIKSALREAADEQQKAEPGLIPLEQAMAARMQTALAFLTGAGAAERLPAAPVLAGEAARIVQAAGPLAGIMPRMVRLRNQYYVLVFLTNQLNDNARHEPLIKAIRTTMGTVRTSFSRVQADIGAAPYPLDHSRPDMTLREYLVPRMPKMGDLDGYMTAGAETLERYFSLNARLAARLAWMTEQVEDALGLPRLPDPPPAPADPPRA